MTQIAVVEKNLDNGYAQVSVARKSACGHDCEECAGCGVSGAVVMARAKNPIGAQVGQKVVVESSTQRMLGIVSLVYFTPILLFFIGYFATFSLGNTTIQYVTAGVGFLLGILAAVLYDRRLKKQGGLSFTILRLF